MKLFWRQFNVQLKRYARQMDVKTTCVLLNLDNTWFCFGVSLTYHLRVLWTSDGYQKDFIIYCILVTQHVLFWGQFNILSFGRLMDVEITCTYENTRSHFEVDALSNVMNNVRWTLKTKDILLYLDNQRWFVFDVDSTYYLNVMNVRWTLKRYVLLEKLT